MMSDLDVTSTSIEEQQAVTAKRPVPVLLVAHAPADAAAGDRCRLGADFSIGRKAENDLTIRDHKISGRHLRIFVKGAHFMAEDLGSTNGTYLDGERLTEPRPLSNHAVLRVGQTVLVFHGDGEPLLTPPPIERYGMAGRFHVAAIVKQLEEAALSRRHLLLAGPSGSGKELAAEAIAAILSQEAGRKVPLVAHNSARFSSEEEATSTLFGVGTRVFSNVNPRPGLIERAEGGVLFLDEIHNLTHRVQRSLLRVIEDRQYSRIGETSSRVATVRFVMASNAGDPMRSMAHDLFARLRLVGLPPLAERRADIPSIFQHVLVARLRAHDLPAASVLACFKGEHYAMMCLDGFPADNVRGLIDLADRIATKIAASASPLEAVAEVFSKRFGERAPARDPHPSALPTAPPLPARATLEPTDEAAQSTYDKYKDVIIATYADREENISATMRALNARGIHCSRRWLAVYLKKWGAKKG